MIEQLKPMKPEKNLGREVDRLGAPLTPLTPLWISGTEGRCGQSRFKPQLVLPKLDDQKLEPP